MRNIKTLALAAVVGLAVPTAAAGADPEVTVFGPGTSSCATAFAAGRDNINSTWAWVTGYWSGLNLGMGNDAGSDTDSRGILAEVKLVCDESPSKRLSAATFEAWAKLATIKPRR